MLKSIGKSWKLLTYNRVEIGLVQIYAKDGNSESYFNIMCAYIGHTNAFICCCRPEVTLGVKEIPGKKSKHEVSAGMIS